MRKTVVDEEGDVRCLKCGAKNSFTEKRTGKAKWAGGRHARSRRARDAEATEVQRVRHEPQAGGLTPLRTRGIARVRQHADLVMIARLGQALVRARAVPLAA